MRFAITGEWKTNTTLRLIIGFFLAFAALFWVTNLLVFHQKLSFSPAAVTR